ncbi:MAG: recombinase family protein, partial [Clostridia bacterium]|nr:recombinase family protein [Clostridia bacterium]
CKAGEIDLILTKEVSRFARNTVDTLAYTRMLKEYDVGVLFINDNIDTRDNDGESRLSIMASVAQEESRKTSERVKWGQRRPMENGVVFGNNSIYGYTLKNGQLTVNEDEAEIIRLIFHKYTFEGKGTHIIARELYEEGIKPPQTDGFWSSTMILRILRNEKYVGDLLQKKYVTKNYLTHEKVINVSEDKIYLCNHHEPIIEREMWNKAQAELDRRSVDAETKKKYSNRYWCSGIIICAGCGSRFTIRKTKRKSGEVYTIWACRERAHHGNRRLDNAGNWVGCNMRIINDKSLHTIMDFIIDQLDADFNSIAAEVAAEISAMADTNNNRSLTLISDQIKAVGNKHIRMLDSYFAGKISEEDMERLRDSYDNELARLNKQLAQIENEQTILKDRQSSVENLLHVIKGSARYSESVYGEIVERITVYDKYLLVKLKYLDFAFKVAYSTHGYKEKYTTKIEKCDIVYE